MKSNFFAFALFIGLILVLGLSSCNEANNKNGNPSDSTESQTSGKITVYCDEAVYDLFQEPKRLYDSAYPDVKLTFTKTDARQAMSMLLSGNARAIVLPRNYLKDEDSLMLKYKVEKKIRLVCAEDALVFFTKKSFLTDTINEAQLLNILTNKTAKFSQYFKGIASEPELVCNDQMSSEYANLNQIALKGKNLQKNIKMFSSPDSVKRYVLNNNAIGIGYLSYVIKDTMLKCLKIGFVDSTKQYIFPHIVHQANIVRRYYPYVVTHYIYLLKDRRDLAFWFGTFMEKETVVQKYFLNSGIVPTFAKINLIEEEE